MTDVLMTLLSTEFTVSVIANKSGESEVLVEYWDGATFTCKLNEVGTLVELLGALAREFNIPVDLETYNLR